MNKKDLFYNAVRRALEKQEWHITNDPLELEWEMTFAQVISS